MRRVVAASALEYHIISAYESMAMHSRRSLASPKGTHPLRKAYQARLESLTSSASFRTRRDFAPPVIPGKRAAASTACGALCRLGGNWHGRCRLLERARRSKGTGPGAGAG